MSHIFKNLLGLLLGLLGMNGMVFLIVYFRGADMPVASMIVACAGSFVYFTLMYFTKIYLLQKSFALGMVLTFIGGFLNAGFIVNEWDTRTLASRKGVLTCDSVSHLQYVTDTSSLIKFKESYPLLTAKGSFFYEFRSSSIDCHVFPLLNREGENPDSIQYWVAYERRNALFDLDDEDYMASIQSPNRLAWRYAASFRIERFKNAMQEANKALGKPNAAKPVFFEMVDLEQQSAFWRRRVYVSMGIMNALWLLFVVTLITKKEDAPQ